MPRGNKNPSYRFPFGSQNPRQLERKQMLERMFEEACRVQKALIEELGDKYEGIPINQFLASFRLNTGSREYTSKQYFKDFETTKRFIRKSSDFKVAEEHYQEWIAEQIEEPDT